MQQKYIISVLIDNEFGGLARVVGLFSARGYNIESLSVSVIDTDRNISRITIVTTGTQDTIALVIRLLDRIVPVHYAINLTTNGDVVERGLCLCKVDCVGDKRVEALRIAQIFRANVVDSTHQSFIFEIFGKDDKINAFIDLMKPLGLSEVSKTGVAALLRGNS